MQKEPRTILGGKEFCQVIQSLKKDTSMKYIKEEFLKGKHGLTGRQVSFLCFSLLREELLSFQIGSCFEACLTWNTLFRLE